jgi:hypothetical protein
MYGREFNNIFTISLYCKYSFKLAEFSRAIDTAASYSAESLTLLDKNSAGQLALLH